MTCVCCKGGRYATGCAPTTPTITCSNGWSRTKPTAILPLLFPGLVGEVLEELNVEVLLARVHRLPEAEMLHAERRIRMFDPLLDNDPWVKEKLAEGETRGLLTTWLQAGCLREIFLRRPSP